MPKCPKDCHKPNPLIFRRVIIPPALGDDKTYPPENGAYCNALVIYEANNAMYLYSSDGIPTKIPTSITSYNDLTDKPMINGVEVVGDVTLEELGITDLIGAEAEARAAADEALQDAIDAETAAREAADREIIGQIPTVNDATLTIQKNGSQVAVFTANSATDTVANIEVPTATSALINDSGYITNTVDNLVNYYDKDETDTIVETEALTRDAADQDLQEQIDAIVASSDVVDIVGTYAELQNYDTSKLHDNDIIKVLTDETRDDATTYYRWDDGTDTFTYIGSEGPYYTKGEADATFVPLTRTINGKGLNSDVVLTAADVGALPSSTVIPTVNDATLTIQKNGTNVATFTANSATNTTANIAVPTKTSDLVNDGSDNTSTYVEADELATVATSGSYNDLTDKPANFELVEMSYGESNAWAKFIAAYQGHKIVYCRAGYNANPATGAQDRRAFMAYVNNAKNPTSVEFQYVRSVATKTAAQPVDQVFIYTLDNRNGGTWTVQTRDMAPKLAQGTNTTVSYSNGTYTISATGETYTAGSNINISNQNVISAIVPTKTSDLTNDGSDGSSTYVEATDLATVATTGAYSDLTGTPTIPTVNDATLTIQRNGTNVETFTANSSTNKTANIVVPTLTSDLTNDSGFVTDTDYASASTGGVVKVGAGLSITNGVLSVTGGGVADAVEWTNVLNRPSTVSYWTNDAGYITSAALPTKTSDLTNDGSDGTSTYVEADDLATVATSGSYNDLSNKPTIPTVNDATITIQRNSTNVDSFTVNASQNKSINIVVPTKTSDLTNDSNFATTSQIPTKTSDLTNDSNFATTSQIPTKTSDLTNDSGFITTSGTAAKANQLATARTIAISGGVTGTATSFDGTSDISIPVTYVRDSYTVWGGKDIVGDISPDDAGCTDEFGHNKLAFLPAECIEVKYSTDGGTTWTDYGLTDAQKIAMVTTTGPGVGAGKNATINASNIANMRGRIRIACGATDKKMKLYTALKKILINFSTNGANGTKVKIRRRTIANYLSGTETWDDLGTHNVSGWPGWNSYPYSGNFGGNMTFQTGYWGQIEFEWWGESCASGAINARCSLIDIRFIGTTNWATPSEMAKNGRLYTIDTAQNVTFPADVNVTGSLGHGKYTYTLPNKNGTVAMTSDIPSVPTVNNGQLTIQKNGSNVATFTANASSNVTANISVPTATSDLTNDSGFITSITKITNAEIDAIMGVA